MKTILIGLQPLKARYVRKLQPRKKAKVNKALI
jgi:hypothetical protein